MRATAAIEIGRPAVPTAGRNFFRVLRSISHRSNSRFIGWILRLSLYLWVRLKGTPPTGFHRSVASVLQPRDPLRRERELPSITVAIPFVEKDLETLPLVVQSVFANVRNPIREILLITPGKGNGTKAKLETTEHRRVLAKILSESETCRLVFDGDVLGNLLSRVLNNQESHRDGYAIQTIIKFKAALSADTSATLVVDADTVLLEPKTWITKNGVQLLHFSEEYHQPYRDLISSYFGFEPVFPGSFVTHHQLLQKDIVREIFGSDLEIKEWYLLAKSSTRLKTSEYETYGQFVIKFFGGRYRFGNWSNLWSPFRHRFSAVAAAGKGRNLSVALGGYNSVSFHAHGQLDL